MNAPRMKLMLAVAGILAAATSSLFAAGYSRAEITRLFNDVKVLKENVAPKAATVGQQIDPVTSVATGVGSRAELRFPDKSLTRLGANSRFTLRGDSRTLDLEQGVILLQVPEQIRGAKVRTAAVTAAVTGGTALIEYLPGGYIKLIVIEGFVDIFMNNDPSKFKTFNAGQMLIMKADGTSIPDAVDVDLKALLKTSKLLGNNDEGSINQQLVQSAVQQQQQQIQNGELQPTNLMIPGSGTQVLIDTSQRTNLFTNFGIRDAAPPPGTQPGQDNPLNIDVKKLQQAQAAFQGFAPLIKGKTVLNNNSTIQTNPHVNAFNVRDNDFVMSEGVIYNGNEHGLLQYHVFGNASVIKPELQEKLNLSGDWALFRFEDLFINGTPVWDFDPFEGGITTFGVGEGEGEGEFCPPKNIILASDNGIRIGALSQFRSDLPGPDDDIPGEAGGYDASPGEGGTVLNLGNIHDYYSDRPEKLILISNKGSIDVRSATSTFAISGYNQDVSIIAAGIGSDVNIEGGIALAEGSEGGHSSLEVIAGRDVNVTNQQAVVASDVAFASGRNINVSNSVVRANRGALKMRSGGNIAISNSSQLKALIDSPDALIKLEAQGNVNLDLTDLEAPQGTIDLVSNQGSITLNQVTSSSDVFKATTLSPSGWITIGNSTINATKLIDLYAAGAHGGVRFVDNATLNSLRVDIRGNTIDILNGKEVQIPQGVLNTTTANRLFNRSDRPLTEPAIPNKGTFIIGSPHP
ncbi:hypothetical protein AYO49_00995 [Verrucomicrobiaceae bacterium SCGC AG-212-N21]|nr:hypothetical protein AYO49_00995 [Verrucomicrobiaceae bacterium SCGC AG-212-N21]